MLRAGSAPKRAAILAAARELFLTDGFERASVDAVAARAKVSKRTVYDYFGDKQRLLVAVVDEAAGRLLTGVHDAIERELTGATDLERALIAFARRLAAGTIGSSDYVAVRRLLATESTHTPELLALWASTAPEDALAEQIAELDRRGLLHAPDPRLAADHFVGLTFTVVMDRSSDESLQPGLTADAEYRIVEGVRAFLRAYATESGRNDA